MKAKHFNLQDKSGKSHSLSSFKEKYKVLYFYPKDNTPGCTIQAKGFTNTKDDFKKINAIVIGISGGDNETKEKFCKAQSLDVLLLSDTDFSVSKSYNSYGEKSFMGRKYLGIKRTTFILDKNNSIIKVFENVKPLGHAKEVLSFIKSLK